MIEIEKKKLASGLTVIMVPMERESVTVLGMVRAGSRDEIEGEYGGAHFLEHMVFKGTKKFPEVGDIAKAVESVGGVQNAYTDNEMTGFWVKAPADKRGLAVKVVGQLMGEPLLDEKEFNKEKGTIIEEIRMYKDVYPVVAEEKFGELVFRGTGLARPVAGTEESIEKMKVENLKAFRDRWYWGENMVVVVAGRLGDKKKLVEEIEEEFRAITEKGKWQDKRKKERKALMRDDRVKITKKVSGQVNLVMGVSWFRTCNRRRYAAEVMNRILGGGMSSRLWKEIREKRGLAYFVRSSVSLGKDEGTIYVQAGIRRGKEEEAVRIIKEEVLKLTKEMVSEEELRRAKERSKGLIKLKVESSGKVAEDLAHDWLLNKGRARTFEERIKGVEAVTREKILDVAKEMFEKDKWCLSVVGDFKEKKKEEELRKVLKS